VYAVLAHKCNEKECHPIAIGGTEDHVHVLVEVDPKVSPANLVQELKGISSHLMTHKVRPGEPFKWQAGYGAFSVSKRHVPQIKAYIENQERHHREGTVFEELERDK
jgi:REP element-mobilizing transposase RayT